MVDFSDHHCYEDKCYVFTPNGYAATWDGSHYAEFYTRHWASAVDFIADF